MTLCKRLIARLDIKGNKLIKGIRFEGLRVLGDPVEAAYRYAHEGIDEMLFIDAVASLYGRNSLTEILRQTTREVFVPITAGGGIRSISDAAKLLASGADKIALNSEALQRPQLISELAQEFGSQCVVVSIQARRIHEQDWEAMGEAGRERSGRKVITWMQEVQDLGAGEILLTSIDQDGTCQGPDYALIEAANNIASIPLVVGGGFAAFEDINTTFNQSAVSGISIGAAFHKQTLEIGTCKSKLKTENLAIRHFENKLNLKSPLSEIKIGIIDYGMGNQQSLINAIEHLGATTRLSDQWDEMEQCDLLMLPGVGAFPEGIRKLRQRKLFEPLINWGRKGKPLIGICLGMQMLFEKGEEFEPTEGLGLFKGTVKKMNPCKESDSSIFPLPHMGWNQLISEHEQDKAFNGIDQYFVHSYAAKDVDPLMIMHSSRYGNETIVASIQTKKTCGFQFHPERSGENGLSLLKTTILQLL